MYGLRQKLSEEEQYLKGILVEMENKEQEYPDGTLRISVDKNNVRYYQCMPGAKGQERQEIYIPKKEQKLPAQLAQKTYDNKVYNLVRKRLEQIRRIRKDYEDDEIEKIYTKEHFERQRLICPVCPTWEQRLQKWKEQEYKGKLFGENTPVITTIKGERVRSKSEKILADYFYHENIEYKYECPLNLKGFGTVYPDFTFLSKKTGEEIYWEHDGRMDDPEYARKAVKKIATYEKNGILPGKNLILTFETSQDVLDMKLVEKLVKEYLI